MLKELLVLLVHKVKVVFKALKVFKEQLVHKVFKVFKVL